VGVAAALAVGRRGLVRRTEVDVETPAGTPPAPPNDMPPPSTVLLASLGARPPKGVVLPSLCLGPSTQHGLSALWRCEDADADTYDDSDADAAAYGGDEL